MNNTPQGKKSADDTPEGGGWPVDPRVDLGSYHQVTRALPALLSGKLPGYPAQSTMAPRPAVQRDPGAAPPDVVHAAGLFLIYSDHNVPRLVLTVRADHLPTHRGQISLPGGVMDPGETITVAALREAHEEMGIESHTVTVLGALSPLYIPVSKFLLHPVVALSDTPPVFQPNPGEVARVLTPTLQTLASPALLRVEQREIAGRERDIPLVDLEGDRLWGATSMIVAEFLALLGHPVRPPWDSP